MPDVPPPEAAAQRVGNAQEHAADHARSGAALLRARAADRAAPGRVRALRRQEGSRTAASTSGSAPPSRLPDDLAIHQCVLAYASDMTLLDAALAPHGRTLFEKEFMAASLDHALWLHRPFRADDWLLYAQDSPNMHGSRGFSRGLIFTRDGTLVASVAQEGLVRLRREPSSIDREKWRAGRRHRVHDASRVAYVDRTGPLCGNRCAVAALALPSLRRRSPLPASGRRRPAPFPARRPNTPASRPPS